jgi:hypothetical protein
MNKVLVFDMDGTLVDLYGVENWLEQLRSFNPRPYVVAKPLYDMKVLKSLLEVLKANGWKIVITSWLSKETTPLYDEMVRVSKKYWLDSYSFPYDELHFVKYGTTKANCTRKLGGYQIIVDDNEKVRKGWHLGDTIDANENILVSLIDLIMAEF